MSSQWSQGVMAPPEGITPNFVNPPDQTEGNIALHTVCLTLSTLAVAMRLHTRLYISRTNLGLDDYLCIVAYAAVVVWSAMIFMAFRWGIGRHIWDMPIIWLVSALKYQTIASQIYWVAATFVKLSLLFLYRRLFNPKTSLATRIAVNGGIIVIICFNLGILLGILFFCIPVQKAWDDSLEGHCTSPVPLSYLSGVWNSLVDIYVLVLPIPLVWRLNMNAKQKLRLAAVFGIGVFVCVASLVRLGMTPILQSDTDSTWNIARISIFSTLEINVGLICSCLMLLPAFLRHHLPESAKSYLRSISFSKAKSTKGSDSSHGHRWHGYQHKIPSESQPAMSKEDRNITRTETFTLNTLHARDDLEAGSENLVEDFRAPARAKYAN